MTFLPLKNNIGYALGFVIVLFFVAYSFVGAATPSIILTWKTNNFYPSDFQGKALPITGSVVTASAAVLRDGALTDPKEITFTWYLDDTWITQELGKREVTVTASKLFGDAHFIRVVASLPTGERIDSSVKIPVTHPDLVIEVSEGESGNNDTLRVIPFFFNVSSLANLIFSWEIDGIKQSSQSNTLSLPSGLAPTASVLAKNAANPLEFTKITVSLP